EATQVQELPSIESPQPVKGKPVRKPLPSSLPRETVSHPPVPAESPCPSCGGKLRYLGEDVSEILERVPEQFKVIRYVRPKFSCSGCSQILQAPAPSRPIERSIAGAGLLAHILTAKYCDHQPLYRQSQIYARDGIDLDRSTLAGRSSGSRHCSRSKRRSAVARPMSVVPFAKLARDRCSMSCTAGSMAP